MKLCGAAAPFAGLVAAALFASTARVPLFAVLFCAEDMRGAEGTSRAELVEATTPAGAEKTAAVEAAELSATCTIPETAAAFVSAMAFGAGVEFPAIGTGDGGEAFPSSSARIEVVAASGTAGDFCWFWDVVAVRPLVLLYFAVNGASAGPKDFFAE